jgi:hypothetical protein
MNYKPLDSLKPLAAQLAEHIASRDRNVDIINELLKKMDLLPTGKTTEKIDTKPRADTSASNGIASIGIWRKKEEAGRVVYQRDPAERDNWSAWSNTDVLYPKETRRRIVLFGESVARGYFYDPYYNVAKELEAILNGIPEGRDIEVVDLAKTSQIFIELLTLVRSSVVLEPDVVIFFAGNNWGYDLLRALGDHNNGQTMEAFRELGMKGIIPFLEWSAQGMVREFFSIIQDKFVKRGIPVIFIVPEFNLKDWKSDDKENALAWLPEDHTEKWAEMKEDALAAIRANDIDRLGTAASEMVALYPFNAISQELLGIFHIFKGDYKQARTCFECSRDAALVSGTKFAPRCVKMFRDQLLHQAGNAGIEIVDLPSIFEDAYPAHIPDRQEFLDYCHLTVEGIKTAMRYTAQKVIGILYGKNIEIDSILASGLFPDNDVSAVAHFSAAIHNAHHGQPMELLQYHCSKAIQYSSKIKEVMLKFVDFSTRYAPSYFCASYAELIHDGEMIQYEGAKALLHWPGKKIMDISLVNVIASTLGKVVPGIGDEVDRLRKSEHGITVGGVDLMESFYSRAHYNFYLDEQDTGLYQARTLESDFYFVLGKRSDPLLFEISCRLPGVDTSKAMIGIRLNDSGNVAARLPASADWVTHSFRIGEEYLVDGVNKLSIKWPFINRAIPNDLPVANHSILKIVFPVIGEISSFTARILPVDE